MKEPHERAGGDDRDAGLKSVRDAARAGRIGALDADHRIQQIKAARTIGEIDIHTRDLRDVPPVGPPLGPPSVGQPLLPPGPRPAMPPPNYRPGPPPRQPNPGARFSPPGRPTLREAQASPLRIVILVFIGIIAVGILVPLAIAFISLFAMSAVDDDGGRLPGPEPSPSASSVLTP